MQTKVSSTKLFMAVIYEYSNQARVLVPEKPFHPSIMFVGKPRCLREMLHSRIYSLHYQQILD